MRYKKWRRMSSGSLTLVAGIAVLIAAPGTPSESTEVAVEQAGPARTIQSQWDDEPVENLEPAPKTARAPKKYSWELQHAKTDDKGDLAWTPKPFVFESGDSVRYIDFENGRDSDDGRTKNTAWKHHPWDSNAAGQAASCSGVQTYVFRRGTSYRGTLSAQESGLAGNPIRLTSDPSWGKGEAVICGSVKITGGWKKGAEHDDIPNKSRVWYTDLDFAPRNIWMGSGDKVTRIPFADTCGFPVKDPEDVKKDRL